MALIFFMTGHLSGRMDGQGLVSELKINRIETHDFIVPDDMFEIPACQNINVSNNRNGNMEHVVHEFSRQYSMLLVRLYERQRIFRDRQDDSAMAKELLIIFPDLQRRFSDLGGDNFRSYSDEK